MTHFDEQPRRRRRRGRRGGRGRGQPGGAAVTTPGPRRDAVQPDRPQSRAPQWEWRTFPVFVAFVSGIVLMGLAWTSPVLFPTFFFFGLFGLAYAAAHFLTRRFFARRRR